MMLRMNGLAVAVIAGALLVGQESFAQGPPNIIYEREGANAATIDFSPDGRFLATGGLRAMNPFTSGQIKFWSAPDGMLLTTITENGTLGYGSDVQFSPDGQRVVSANGTVDCVPDAGCFASRPGQFVWSFPAGTMLATSPPEGVPREQIPSAQIEPSGPPAGRAAGRERAARALRLPHRSPRAARNGRRGAR